MPGKPILDGIAYSPTPSSVSSSGAESGVAPARLHPGERAHPFRDVLLRPFQIVCAGDLEVRTVILKSLPVPAHFFVGASPVDTGFPVQRIVALRFREVAQRTVQVSP